MPHRIPYKTNDDLPAAIRKVLPTSGQDTYREAYNKSWEKYEHLKDKASDVTDDMKKAAVDSAAWEAVKKLYHKVGDMWEKITH